MKKLLICLSLLPTLLMGQKVVNERDVPERIVSDFHNRAPEATSTKWERFDSVTYQVTYLANNIKTALKFSNVSVETRWNVDTKWTPQTIKQYVDTAYAKSKIESVWIADAQGKKTYEVNVKQKKKEYLLKFELDGKFIEAIESNPKKKK